MRVIVTDIELFLGHEENNPDFHVDLSALIRLERITCFTLNNDGNKIPVIETIIHEPGNSKINHYSEDLWLDWIQNVLWDFYEMWPKEFDVRGLMIVGEF